MKRFFKRIQEKALDPAQAPVLMIAFGDSVTQGVMEHKVLVSASTYHRLIQNRLEAFFPLTTFSTLNAGVSGGTVRQALDRLERDVLRHQPDLVFVAFGLNDSLGGREKRPAFEMELDALVKKIAEGSGADILLLTPPFMATKSTARIHPEHVKYTENIIARQNDGTLAEYAQSIRAVARRNGVALADIHSEWERLRLSGFDTDLWLVNGLNHPGRAGHVLAAEILQAVLFRPYF